MDVEIQKILVCSTCHLTEEVCNTVLPKQEEVTVFLHEYGVIVHIPYYLKYDNHDSEAEKVLRGIIGETAVDILNFAGREHDCWAVNFDCDAQTLDNFKEYDW